MSLAIDSDPITTTPKLAVVTINGDGGSNAGDSTTDSVDANNRDGAGDESNGAASPDPDAEQHQRRFEKELEAAQQRAFERLTSFAGLGAGFRPSFPLTALPPFLAAALQSNPLALQSMLGAAGVLGGNGGGGSPGMDEDDMDDENDDEEEEDDDGGGSVEPEDLSIGKEKKAPSLMMQLDDSAGGGGVGGGEAASQQNWSYEEQFKQLYELSDDLKRKEWLDDWLSFMHRIGKPVTRIPIMAKQVLDLYELYRLVVQHGGLVEIINKKLWREITKGLNLPSSITSAAFTLRTQYQKFLYDYECDKECLSSPSDLQQAIDGNRREGRRNNSTSSHYPPINYSLSAPTLLGKHHHSGVSSVRTLIDDDSGFNHASATGGQQAALVAAYRAEQLAAIDAQRHFERAQRAAVEAAVGRQQHPRSAPAPQQTGAASGRASTSSSIDSVTPAPPPSKRCRPSSNNNNNVGGCVNGTSSATSIGPPTSIGDGDAAAVAAAFAAGLLNNPMERLFGIPSAHLKITSRDGSRTGIDNSSLVVSMEINGVMYQGVLFALNGVVQQNGTTTVGSGVNSSMRLSGSSSM